jgi:integrase
VFKQIKTKGNQVHYISEDAVSQLGPRGDMNQLIFGGLTYGAHTNMKLKEWIYKAGIRKDITFHCARHTYATLQLLLGTDFYTVSKLMGHKSVKNTQVYLNAIDQSKIDAANKINLD